MICWPKDAFDKSTKDEDKAFLVLTQKTDRIASLIGKDMKTYEMEKKRKKKKDASLRLKSPEEQRKSKDTVAVLLISSEDQSSSVDENTNNDLIKRSTELDSAVSSFKLLSAALSFSSQRYSPAFFFVDFYGFLKMTCGVCGIVVGVV